MKIITGNEVIDFSDFKPSADREYNYNKRCNICNAPYMKNKLLPEEMINILGDKIRYIPSCNCHEKMLDFSPALIFNFCSFTIKGYSNFNYIFYSFSFKNSIIFFIFYLLNSFFCLFFYIFFISFFKL